MRIAYSFCLLALLSLVPRPIAVSAQEEENSNEQTATEETNVQEEPGNEQLGDDVDSSGADESDSALDPRELEAFIDGLMAGLMESKHVAGVSISIVADDQVVLSKGYGYADVKQRRPVSAKETMFQIGSITKLFTWTAVMRLVEQGKLDLKTDINQYLTDLEVPNTFAEPITLEHLMAHTPGFEDRVIGLFAVEERPLIEVLKAELPARVRPPGKHSAYSNHGTAIAGHIVATVSGMSWEEYVKRNILEPLEMQNTRVDQPYSGDVPENMSKGYEHVEGEFVERPFMFVPLSPAGCMASTADDMSRFMLAHLRLARGGDSPILDAQTAKRMHGDLYRNHPDATPAGYGFAVQERAGVRAIGHDGSVISFVSKLTLYPDQQMGIFVSQNTSENVLIGDVANAFFRRYVAPEDGRPAEERSADVTARRDVAGTYCSLRQSYTGLTKLGKLFGRIDVDVSPEGKLHANDRIYEPVKPLVFMDDDDNRVVFQENDQGEVTHMFMGLTAYERIPWFEAPAFQIGLVSSCLFVVLSAVLGWPFVGVVLRGCEITGYDPKRGQLLLTLIGWLVAVAVLVFAFLFVFVGRDQDAILRSEISLLYSIVEATPYLAGGVGLVGICTLVAFIGGYWRRLARLHYGLVFVAMCGLLWFLYHWNLLPLSQFMI